MKKTSRIAAGIMLMVAIGFFIYAINHPEGAFPWSNTMTYTIYGVYLLVMIVLFIAPFADKTK